jgi:hypothetical protein
MHAPNCLRCGRTHNLPVFSICKVVSSEESINMSVNNHVVIDVSSKVTTSYNTTQISASQHWTTYMRFESFTKVNIYIVTFQIMTRSSLVNDYQRSRGTCFPLQNTDPSNAGVMFLRKVGRSVINCTVSLTRMPQYEPNRVSQCSCFRPTEFSVSFCPPKYMTSKRNAENLVKFFPYFQRFAFDCYRH